MSQKTFTYCDICKSDTDVNPVAVPCIFTTETTEGRSVKPHLTNEKIDACKECYKKIFDAQPLWGSGAMGHNTYTFKEQT